MNNFIKGTISALLSLALLLASPVFDTASHAFIFRGGTPAGGGGATLLTTMTLVNTSGSTQVANFVTDIFGHPFKKGDIPNGCSGAAPQFQLTNGTNIPFSEGLVPLCWSDGSLKWAPFLLRVPTSIAGSGSLTINILNGGTTPSASSRSLSDFAAGGADLNISVTGLTGVSGFGNLTGVWVSDLNQGVGVSHADDYHYMGGQAGDVWRVRASFRQSSADHGQLEAYWYVQALQDNAGGLYGLRTLERIAQPWYNLDTPTKNWRGFSAMTVNNGVSVIRDEFASNFGTGRNFTWSSGANLNSTANTFSDGWLLNLTTTGSLPTGLATGQAYFTTASATNLFQVASNSNGGSGITPTGSCSGTCTATPYPYLTQFGSLFPQGSTGKADYVQGAGSVASDHTTRIQFNNLYWRSTRMVPPYQIGIVSPGAQTSYSFSLMGSGPVSLNTPGTGERPDIGVFNDWSAGHVYTQDAGSTQTVRTVGLVGGNLPINLKSTSTFTSPVVNNTTYSGLPSPNINFRWKGQSGQGTNVVGFTQPLDTNVYIQMFNTATVDHMTDFEYYATLLFGEPQFYDMTLEWGAYALMPNVGPTGQSAIINGSTNAISGNNVNGGGGRDSIINGTHYYGALFTTGSGLREEAWGLRYMGEACGMASTYGVNAANQKTYLCDNVNSSYNAYNAYIGLLPAYAQSAGFFYEPGSFGGYSAPWEVSYHLMTDNLVYSITEISAILTFSNYMTKFTTWVDANFGVYMVTCYYCTVRTGVINIPAGNESANPYIGSTALFGGGNTTFNTSWNSGTNLFTMTGGPHSYAPRNNDQVSFNNVNSTSVPGGFTAFTQYFIVNASGNDFQLSGTVGGSPITITDTASSNQSTIGVFSFSSTNNTYSYPGTGSGYLQSIACGMNWTLANGGTPDATALGHVNTNLQSITGYLAAANSTPKYSCAGTF